MAFGLRGGHCPALFVLSLGSASSLVPLGDFSNLPRAWVNFGAFLKCIGTCQVMTENKHLTFQCLDWIGGEDVASPRAPLWGSYRRRPETQGERKRFDPHLDNEHHTWFPVQSLQGAGLSVRLLLTHPARTPLANTPSMKQFLLCFFFSSSTLSCKPPPPHSSLPYTDFLSGRHITKL